MRSLAGTNVGLGLRRAPLTDHGELVLGARGPRSVRPTLGDGEPIPEDLFDKMHRARTFRSASAMMRQLGFATVDLALHMDYEPTRDGDVLAYGRAIAQPFRLGAATRGPRDAPVAFSTCSRTRSATPAPTTATSGPRCSTPTPSPPSRREGSSARGRHPLSSQDPRAGPTAASPSISIATSWAATPSSARSSSARGCRLRPDVAHHHPDQTLE